MNEAPAAEDPNIGSNAIKFPPAFVKPILAKQRNIKNQSL